MAHAQSLYEEVTARIVALLEQGVKPWQQPWKSVSAKGHALIPTNAATGRGYTGMNVILLWLEANAKGYPSHGWMTFRQANDLGARVRKGEKSCTVIYTKTTEKEVDDGKGGTELKKVPILKTYHVFNLAQLDDLPPAYLAPVQPMPEDERLDGLRNLVRAAGIKVSYGGREACYMPHRDEVRVPAYGDFVSDDAFASVLLHELVHATGHRERLNRTYGKRFGDEAYAAEELVAEMGSAFLCAHLGFEHERESAAYLDSWLKVMKADARAIFTAASYASRAADWLREREHALTGPDDPDQSPARADDDADIAA